MRLGRLLPMTTATRPINREYADISLSNLQIRRLTGPYLVKGRIVQPALGYAVG